MKHHPPDITLACHRGCSFCCYNFVAVSAPEVFRLARYLRSRGGLANVIAHVEGAHQATKDATSDDRLRTRRPCGTLESSVCAAYSVRPLVCESANSTSVDACENAFNDGVTNISTAGLPLLLKDAHVVCLLAALNATDLDARIYEMNHAMCVALADSAAESRWLSGENVFAGVQQEPSIPPPMRQFVEQLAASL